MFHPFKHLRANDEKKKSLHLPTLPPVLWLIWFNSCKQFHAYKLHHVFGPLKKKKKKKEKML